MVHAEIELRNPGKPELKPLSVQPLVDAGPLKICIPEHTAVQLQLAENTVHRLRKFAQIQTTYIFNPNSAVSVY